MVARSENIDRRVEEEEEEEEESTLMLLTRVGESGSNGGGGESRCVYRCKTCMKAFSSFQALGGHRASHNKPTNSNSSTSDVSTKRMAAKKTTSHTCPICGMDFGMGQALGGHMRKHRDNNKYSGGTLVTRSLFPEETTTVTLKKPISGKRVVCFDSSDGDDKESTINLKFTLGYC